MVASGKPTPGLYLAAGKLRVDSCFRLAFDYSPAGIASTKFAGMTVVAARTKLTAGTDLSNADHVIDRLDGFDCTWGGAVGST